MHQALMLPRQPAKQDRGVIPLQLSERQFCRPVEVRDFLARDAGFLLQPPAFGFQTCRIKSSGDKMWNKSPLFCVPFCVP